MTKSTKQTVLKHLPYVNARGELIDNGKRTDVWCSWPHRDTCPLCMAMERGNA